MVERLLLFIVTMSIVVCARRFNLVPGLGAVPHTRSGPTHQGPTIRAPVRMQLGTLSDDGSPSLWSNDPAQWWKANISDTQRWSAAIGVIPVSHQLFPPTVIYGMDLIRILHTWEDSYMPPLRNSLEAAQVEKRELPPSKARKHWRDNNTVAIHRMRLRIRSTYSKSTGRFYNPSLEMVGLIGNDFELPFLESGSSVVDTSVRALAVFSRAPLQRALPDLSPGKNRGGMDSLQKIVDKEWNNGARPCQGVFQIEGLAEMPGLSERSSKALVSKIAKYALQEHRVLLVSKRARIMPGGTDLTEHYVRLGFKKVAMQNGAMQNGSVLIYTGSSSLDVDMSDRMQLIMVGMNGLDTRLMTRLWQPSRVVS